MTVYVRHSGDVSGNGPSPALWNRADVIEALAHPDRAYHAFDDFISFNGLLTTTVGDYTGQAGGYYSYQDTGDTITQIATEVGGVIRIATDGTDNDEAWLQLGGSTGVFGKIASSSGKLLIFEARFRIDTITARNLFLGLAEEGFAAADAITDAGAMVTTKDFIGFRSLEGDANGLDTVYQKASQTTGVVKDDAHTLVASTWVKAGLVFDPERTVDAIRFYINGVKQADVVASSVLDDATFPDGEELTFVAGVKNGGAVATLLDLDWFRLFQMR